MIYWGGAYSDSLPIGWPQGLVAAWKLRGSANRKKNAAKQKTADFYTQITFKASINIVYLHIHSSALDNSITKQFTFA